MTTRQWWAAWGAWGALVALTALCGGCASAPLANAPEAPSCVVDRMEGEWAVVEVAIADTVFWTDVNLKGVGEGDTVDCQLVAEYDARGGTDFCTTYPDAFTCEQDQYR